MPHTYNLPDYEPITKRRGRASTRLPEDPLEAFETVLNKSDQTTQSKVMKPETATAVGEKVTLKPILKRGHTLSFIGLFLFTFVLYFRPYEFSPSLAWTSTSAFWTGLLTVIIFLITQFALDGRLTVPGKEINLVLMLLLVALLSIPLALDRSVGWETFKEFIKPVLMFIVLVNVVRSERRLYILFFLMFAVSGLLSVAALKDFWTGNLTGDRVIGVVGNLFDNPNSLALHLVTMIPIAIALLLSTASLVKKSLYAGLSFVMISAVIVSFSRGGFIGLIISLAFLMWKLRKNHRTLVLSILVFAVLVLVVLVPSGYGIRLSSIFDASLDQTGSAGQRQELLWRSLKVALRHPLLGIGIGNFPSMGIHNLGSHNAYTQVASEMGMGALALYVMFIVVPLKRLRQMERVTFPRGASSRFHYLAIGLQASLIGYMVNSFFAHVAYQYYIYYLVGYAVSILGIFEGMVVAPSSRENGVGARPLGSQR